MFCPRCGKADQSPDSYCRQCGLFLPNLNQLVESETPPEEHLKANTVLSLLTISASFTLAILLYAILGFRSNTHPLIYVTAGLLLGMGGWHIQTLIRTQQLKKQWKKRAPLAGSQQEARQVRSGSTAKLLDQADFENSIPASVTETTTRHLTHRNDPRSHTN
jgi:hypothetical protein